MTQVKLLPNSQVRTGGWKVIQCGGLILLTAVISLSDRAFSDILARTKSRQGRACSPPLRSTFDAKNNHTIMKPILAIAMTALFGALASDAEEPLTNVYGPEVPNGYKAKLVYVTIRVLEFESNPFDDSSLYQTGAQVDPKPIFDPVTYFEINSLRFHPGPLNEGAKEFFSLIEKSSDQKAHSLNVGKGVSGILSDPQFQVLIRFAEQQRDVVIQQPTSAMVSKDQFFATTVDHGVLLAGTASPMGEGAIALSLFTPSNIGGPLPEYPNTGLIVADGSTLAYTVEAPKGEKTRLYFIQTLLLDPAS